MSQNVHTLLLFFNKSESFDSCFKALKDLEVGSPESVARADETLGRDVSKAWEGDWLNQKVSATAKFIRLDFASNSGYRLPLEILESLFTNGLRLACLEIFNHQASEFAQFFFKDGEQVDRRRLYRKNPKIEAIIREHFKCDPDELEAYLPSS